MDKTYEMATPTEISHKQLERIEQILANQKMFLTIKEAANYCDLRPSYLYKLTSKRVIPHSKPSGKRIYFLKDDLDRWLARNRVKSQQELDSEATQYVSLTNKIN